MTLHGMRPMVLLPPTFTAPSTEYFVILSTSVLGTYSYGFSVGLPSPFNGIITQNNRRENYRRINVKNVCNNFGYLAVNGSIIIRIDRLSFRRWWRCAAFVFDHDAWHVRPVYYLRVKRITHDCSLCTLRKYSSVKYKIFTTFVWTVRDFERRIVFAPILRTNDKLNIKIHFETKTF